MPKYDLSFSPPRMNASGTLGFSPDLHAPVDLSRLGAFITNPVSLASRTPAAGARCLQYPGGILLHTGYPNPGLRAVTSKHAGRWGRSSLPVLVHLLARSPEEVVRLVQRLETLEGVAGFEVGVPPDAPGGLACDLLQAALGERPVLVRLPLERALDLAQAVESCGQKDQVAISLGPPRGALLDDHGLLVQGRLYGPGIFPLALATAERLVQAGFNVIGAGGVYRLEQEAAMLAAGCLAVQLDTVLWRGGLR